MKKIFLTLAIALGLAFTASAQGGLFGYAPDRAGANESYRNDPSGLILPGSHGESGDQSGSDAAPLGAGTAILLGLGAAYLVSKKRNEE